MDRNVKVNFFISMVIILMAAMWVDVSAETLYYDDFSGASSQSLHGSIPDISFNSGTWVGHSSWKADGSGGAFSCSATLPFTPEPGYIYRLTVKFHDMVGDDYWLAMGYTAGSSTLSGGNEYRFIYAPTSGCPWMIRRGNQAVNSDTVFLGPGTSSKLDIANSLDHTRDVTFQILLDTRDPIWSVTWKQKYIGDLQFFTIGTQTYSSNPPIAAVGVASAGASITGRIDDFTLERIQTSLQILEGGQPRDLAVEGSETAVYEVEFSSSSQPTAIWHFVKNGQTYVLDINTPEITVTTVESVAGQYTTELRINNVDFSNEGYYFCELNNNDGISIESDFALLDVNAVLAHWPLGEEGFLEGKYVDIQGGNDAIITGSPIFDVDHEGKEDGAAGITPEEGMATSSNVNLVTGENGAFSISFWSKWNGSRAQQSKNGTMVVENIWGGSHLLEDMIKAGDVWHHVCVTFDGLFANIYFDGQLFSTQSWQLPEAEEVTVELGHISGTNTFNGSLNDIKIFNYVLDEFQIEAMYLGLESPLSDMKKFKQLRDSHQWQEVFFDPCTENWQEKWTIDGLKATINHSEKGMDFYAGPTRSQDASHAVMWTKDVFEGDIRIDYEYTKLDNKVEAVTILYLLATGSGVVGYDQDISLWADKRTVPSMSTYFNHMNTYHISYAAFDIGNTNPVNDYIRARRYMPESDGLGYTELVPDYSQTDLFAKDVPHNITVIKKADSIYMYISNSEKEYVCHWKTNAFPDLLEGRIGLRHMWTRGARYKNFRVSKFVPGNCIIEYASGYDFGGPGNEPDCVVDVYDLIIFTQNWLSCGKYPTCL